MANESSFARLRGVMGESEDILIDMYTTVEGEADVQAKSGTKRGEREEAERAWARSRRSSHLACCPTPD